MRIVTIIISWVILGLCLLAFFIGVNEGKDIGLNVPFLITNAFALAVSLAFGYLLHTILELLED